MAKTKLKTIYKLKWKNLLRLFIILCAFVLVVSLGFSVVMVVRDRMRTVAITEEIKNKVEIIATVDDEMTKTVKPDSKLSKFDAYWEYIKLAMLDVDMEALKRINADSIGYVEIKGTEFSYPVVKSENDFYKNHSFDKRENMFGWLYVDASENFEEIDDNTIIYGNKVWTGVLADRLSVLYKDEWKDNDDNYIVKFTTNHYSALYQVMSVYDVKGTDHLKTSFENGEEKLEFIKDIKASSKIKFKCDAKETDKFLTITTNSKSVNTTVVAKLIKYRTEN